MYLMPKSFKNVLCEKTPKNLDDYFFKILKKLRFDSLIECGANEASASMIANKIGLDALAIEANPETFQQVTPPENKKFKKLNFGLGSKAGLLRFYIPKKNRTAGNATFKPRKGKEYVSSNVNVKKLDEILEQTKYVDSSFALWIDVEGMQYEVLIGASTTLRNKNCKLIKIEVEDLALFQKQKWVSKDVIRYLERLDFELIYRDFEYDEHSQYNLLFIRRDILDYHDSKFLDQGIFNKKPIGIKDCLSNLLKTIPERSKSLAKALVLMLFGKKFGHRITAFAGSKSSKEYNKRL